jgi:hypothetical protein
LRSRGDSLCERLGRAGVFPWKAFGLTVPAVFNTAIAGRVLTEAAKDMRDELFEKAVIRVA